MIVSADLLKVSNEIVELANDLIRVSDPLKKRAMREFVRAKPDARTRVVTALNLTDQEVAGLLTVNADAGLDGGGGERQPEIWDYDIATATLGDLVRRRDLLKNWKRVLEYHRVH